VQTIVYRSPPHTQFPSAAHGSCYHYGMAKIVGIHGIGQQIKGSYSLRDVWFPALKDGLVAADRPDLAEKLSADDTSVGFFGSLFRRKYGRETTRTTISPLPNPAI
jgi:hypothetical protein